MSFSEHRRSWNIGEGADDLAGQISVVSPNDFVSLFVKLALICLERDSLRKWLVTVRVFNDDGIFP